MLLRAAALSILVLIALVVTLPLSYSSAHDTERSATARHLRHHHSRAWWRRYRARLRRKREAALARRRAQEAARPGEQTADASNRSFALFSESSHNQPTPGQKFSAPAGGLFSDPRGMFNLQMPAGWSGSRQLMANGEMRFKVYAPDGRQAGQAALTVVAHSVNTNAPLTPSRMKARALGGVAFTDLRRIVIDKMISSGGWVVNDMEREMGGRRVFIVIAETGASSDGRTPQQAWVYYFTELEGRIYSLATTTPLEFADRVAADSEQVLASFRAGSRASGNAQASR